MRIDLLSSSQCILFLVNLTVLRSSYFLMQAYAKLTSLFEQRMDSYANADARVSLERRFPMIFLVISAMYNPVFFFLLMLYATNKLTMHNAANSID